MRDTWQKALTRISSMVLHGEIEVALEEWKATKHQFGDHWILDLYMAFMLATEEHFREAEAFLIKVNIRHGKVCTSPLCFSKLVPLYLARIAVLEENYTNALTYFNWYLKENGDDIMALFLRGAISFGLWEMEEEIQHLERAILDLNDAYLLLGDVPDNKVYVIKMFRLLIESMDSDAIEKQCKDMRDAGITEDFMRGLRSLKPEYPMNLEVFSGEFVQPAVPLRINIGYELACLLQTIDGSQDDALSLFNEVALMARAEGETSYEVCALGSILVLCLNMHNVRPDRDDLCHIQNAESTLADLLRLEGQHELPDDAIQNIRDLETAFDTLKSD